MLTWFAWRYIICINYNYPWYVNVSCRTHMYTCNMKENALASCISYARSHRVKPGVGAGYGLLIGVGEWVVNSEKKWDKV